MALTGNRTYVGFGFGAIQAGLFLYEAYRSGNFGRLVVAEVLPDVVASAREAGGMFGVNIAHDSEVERTHLGPVEIYNPASAEDREHLITAISEAEEIGTAIPSVAYYQSDGPASLHRILAAGLQKKCEMGGPRAVVYAAENNNHAAEILEKAVMTAIPTQEQPEVSSYVRFLNTVIGKMSGIVVDPVEIQTQGLATATPHEHRAFLVEAFNRILISEIRFDGSPEAKSFSRGIEVFEEKPDLLPFEEAKLYGHNATHALAAYLAIQLQLELISDLRAVPGMMAFLRAAFIEESGAALVRKYSGIDRLFTVGGYREYADDLLHRMTNPFLRDTAERVGRDPRRKLGWNDRLIGTMRLANAQGIEPYRYAFGAAAALAFLDPSLLNQGSDANQVLDEIWLQAQPNVRERQVITKQLQDALLRLRQWRLQSLPNLDSFLTL